MSREKGMEEEGLRRFIYSGDDLPRPITDELLDRVVDQCFWQNKDQDISGILVTDRERMVHLLEGPPSKVASLMSCLQKNLGHQEVKIHKDEGVTERLFINAGMGIVETSGATRSQCDLFESLFAGMELGAPDLEMRARDLIESFVQTSTDASGKVVAADQVLEKR